MKSKNGLIVAEYISCKQGVIAKEERRELNQVGDYVNYKFNVPLGGEYRILLSEYAGIKQGELLVRISINPGNKIAGTYIRENDNRWHLHEITQRYLTLEKGQYTLKVELADKKRKEDVLRLGEIMLTSTNIGETLGGRLEVDAKRAEEMTKFIKSYKAAWWGNITSSEQLREVKRDKPIEHLAIGVSYPEFFEQEITGKSAKVRAFNLIKQLITKDIFPNGFNELVIMTHGGGPRTGWCGDNQHTFDQHMLWYPSRISSKLPFIHSYIKEDEDPLPEVIDYAHQNNLKVILYVGGCNTYYPKDALISTREFEVELMKEVVVRYHPDGVAIELPADYTIWQDIRQIDSKVKLHVYVGSSSLYKTKGTEWIPWTMDNIRFRKEIIPPNSWVYPYYEPVDTPLSFRELMIRALINSDVTGTAIWHSSPYHDAGPYCHVVGGVLREAGLSREK